MKKLLLFISILSVFNSYGAVKAPSGFKPRVGIATKPSSSVTKAAQEGPFVDAKAMIAKYAPQVRFDDKEKFFPASIDWMINQVALYKTNKEGGADELVVNAGSLTGKDLSEQYNTQDYYMMFPATNKEDQKLQQYYKGMPLQGGQVTAPCYINYVVYDNGQRAVIQCFFLYPFNGMTPLLDDLRKFLEGVTALPTAFVNAWNSILKPLGLQISNSAIEDLLKKVVGNHEGDLEQVDVYLVRSGYEVKIEKMYFARHKDKDGNYVAAKDLEMAGTHPIVYAALFGHASYPHPVRFTNLFADSTDGKGPIWNTYDHYVLADAKTVNPSWWLSQAKMGKTHRWPDYAGGPALPMSRSYLFKDNAVHTRATEPSNDIRIMDVKDIAQKVVEEIEKQATQQVKNLVSDSEKIIDKVGNDLKDAYNKAVSAAKGAVDQAKDFFGSKSSSGGVNLNDLLKKKYLAESDMDKAINQFILLTSFINKVTATINKTSGTTRTYEQALLNSFQTSRARLATLLLELSAWLWKHKNEAAGRWFKALLILDVLKLQTIAGDTYVSTVDSRLSEYNKALTQDELTAWLISKGKAEQSLKVQ